MSGIVNQAYVTMVTSDSYVIGALVLAHSLRKLHTPKHIVCLITSSISTDKKFQLMDVFDFVVLVEELQSNDPVHLKLLQRPELGVTFTKMHVFNLVQYEKCVFLDADTLVLQSIDDLFDRNVDFAAAPDVGWPDCFNSGVFVFKPSAATYSALLTHAATVGSFDGGDQGLLNTFFSTWSTGDSASRLSFTYNMTANASYGYVPAYEQFKAQIRVVHFIGAHKPWLGMPHPGPGMHAVVSLVEQWWIVHDDFVSCLSSSASYKTLTNTRPTRSPHHDADVNPPPVREVASGPLPQDVRRPLAGSGGGGFLTSLSFQDVQAAIDVAINAPSPSEAIAEAANEGTDAEEPEKSS